MRRSKTPVFAIAAIAVATATLSGVWLKSRGVRLSDTAMPIADGFDPQQSVGLFIGVRHFTGENGIDVPFAVDDAVDLAYMLTLDKHAAMIVPRRAVLALAGEPAKEESRKRLQQLTAVGVRIVRDVEASDILRLVREQANAVDRSGIYVLSLATHGYVHRGIPYVLGASSRMRDPGTAASAADIADIVGSSNAARSLIFLDACRDRLRDGTRSVNANRDVAASFVERMKRANGQVIFYAAAAGNVAWDDFKAQNGVFTRTVIEGLQCQAAKSSGIVTVANLHSFVEANVKEWIRKNEDASIKKATAITMEGDTRNMPLARCDVPPVIFDVASDGTTITTLAADRSVVWSTTARARVIQAELGDLDGDAEREVVVATDKGLEAFADDGTHLWSFDSAEPPRAIAIGRRFRFKTAIAALSATRLITVDDDGDLVSSLEHSGGIQRIAVYRPTTQHGPKVVAIKPKAVFVLDPAKLAGKPLLAGSVTDTIDSFAIDDRDADGRSEIELSLRGGDAFLVDFKTRRAWRAPNAKPNAEFVMLPASSHLKAGSLVAP